ncbi:MoaD/ThiS family protein [uncultured Tenacibaculum sp.]|uniref:MoaD/ThiS family protein n=1 Tax=uncultured Tenacibaculum sp. TaxID=174713 RepID=UPI002615EE28|nr:MoaD/ThiS family protein [uncultured Tenacibaculum sp.]
MKVIYFGKIADVAKKSSEEINLEENSIPGLVAFLQEKYHLDLDDMQIAVNHNLVSKSEEIFLKEADEIAILSAFAGG